MNIKQAQQLSGVSSDNIRFYEKQGLLCPRRDPENDYRKYTEEDIQILKLIRLLRMLDMPLEQVRAVLSGSLPLPEAAARQKKRLEDRSRQLAEAIRFCQELTALSGLDSLNPDRLLERMEDPRLSSGVSNSWLHDYRRIALSEHEKRFTFLPDEAVTTPREFSAALFQYARDNGLELVITKESMYPEFTINGIEYTATRNYTAVRGCPVASIHCRVMHPEDFIPPDVSPVRRLALRLFHFLWLPFLLFLLFLLPRLELLSSRDGWLLFTSVFILTGVLSFRSWLLFYNENGKK